MATKLTQPGRRPMAASDQRTDARHPVVLTSATARAHGDTPVSATLEDVSSFGCRLTCTDQQAEGARVWLRLSGSMPIAATVVWCTDGRLGCLFDKPIESGLMRMLIRPVH